MTDKIEPKRAGIALASVSGIASIACAALNFIAPQFAVSFLGTIFHGIDISKIAATSSFGSAILGTVIVIILGYAFGWLFGWIYNKLETDKTRK